MFRKVLLVALLLAPTIAIAQVLPGSPYAGVAGGLNFAGSPLSAGGTTQLDTDAGGLGLADLGWAFGNGLRAELEGSHRSSGLSSIDTLRGNGIREPLGSPQGSLKTWAVMVNGAYDIPLANFGLAWPIQPYVGAGAGYAWLDLGDAGGSGLTNFRLPGNNIFASPSTVTFGSAGAFAYQAIAGLAWPLGFLPGIEATVEYRFFGTARADVPVNRVASTTITVNGAIPSESTHNGFVLNDNSLLFGLRYRF
jgi:opacity protein-like surface antigen